MKLKLSLVSIAALVLSFAAMPLAQGQEKPFKPDADHTMVVGSLVKVGTGGEADNATTGTATSTAAAATINADSGKVTTESITTAAAGAATYTFTLTNSKIAAANKVFVSLETTSTGIPVVTSVAPGAGTCVIKIQNAHPSAAFNSTFKISFWVVK